MKVKVGAHGARQAKSLGDLDHMACDFPWGTAEEAKSRGLDIVGFSDHCFRIDGWEWGWRQPYDHWPKKPQETSLRAVAQHKGTEPRCIVGFEWTPNDYYHVNVFGLGKRLLVGRQSAGTKWTYATPEHPDDADIRVAEDICTTEAEFFNRLQQYAASSPGLVCQINHPRAAQRQSGGDGLVKAEDLNEAAEDLRKRGLFCLIEIGSGPVDTSNVNAPALNGLADKAEYQSIAQGEPFYRRALLKDWKVGPTVGNDSQFADLTTAGKRYTGVWAENLEEATVLQALRARHCFATEQNALDLRFWCEAGSQSAIMGDTLQTSGAIACHARVWAPAEISSIHLVEIRRNGSHKETQLDPDADEPYRATKEKEVSHTYDPDDKTICYYVKATMVGGALAVSAPIWIEEDLFGGVPGKVVATSLVVDVSGSMSEPCPGAGSKLQALQSAVATILDVAQSTAQALRQPPAPFGLVQFSEYGTEVAAISTDLAGVQNATQALTPLLSTNLGDGLAVGLRQLSTTPADEKCIILLSDGVANIGMYSDALQDGSNPSNPVKQAADAGIRVFTVGFGSAGALDETLLQAIANMTGGVYYRAVDAFQLGGMYLRASQQSLGTSLMDVQDVISQGETKDLGTFKVETAQNLLRLILHWPGSRVTARLVDPHGKPVDGTYRKAKIVPGNPTIMLVKDPPVGEWKVTVKGEECPSGPEPFSATVAAQEGKRSAGYSGGGGGGGAEDSGLLSALLVAGAVVVALLAAVVVRRRKGLTRRRGPVAPRAWVVVATGPFGRQTHELAGEGPVSVGRGPRNRLVLADPEVSTAHALLRPVGAGWLVVDLGSRNGTFVNGQRVAASVAIGAGDRLTLGRSQLVIQQRRPDWGRSGRA